MKTKNTLWTAGAVLVLSLGAFARDVEHAAVAQPTTEEIACCGDPPAARPVRRTDSWWAKGVPERHLAAIAANKSGHFDLVMVGDSITLALADGDKVRIFDIRKKFLGPDGKLLPGMMAADDLHPIEGGYRVWYDSLVPVVRKLVGRAK